MTVAVPLPAASFLDELFEHPQIIVIALIVIVGAIQGLSRTVKKVLDPSGQNAGNRRRGAGRSRQTGGLMDADPESLLPSFLQSGLQDRAKEAGVQFDDDDEDEWEDEEEYPEPVRRVAGNFGAAQTQPRPQPVRVATPAPEARSKDRISLSTGPDAYAAPEFLETHDVAATHTTHDFDQARSRALIHPLMRPTRAKVREAVLWAEILGPPRALQPYRSPVRRNGGGGGSGPSSIAIVPLGGGSGDSGGSGKRG